MSVIIPNTSVDDPKTGKPLPREVDENGEVKAEWKMCDLMLVAVGQHNAKTVDDIIKAQRLYEALEKQQEAEDVELEDQQFSDTKAICEAFAPYLQKGTLFVNFFKKLREAGE